MVKENKIIPVIFLFILLPFLMTAAEIRGHVKDIYNRLLPGDSGRRKRKNHAHK